jgi:hypothetical protein
MPAFDPCLIRSAAPSGEPVVQLGVQLLDDYLDFVAPAPDRTRYWPPRMTRGGVLPGGGLTS